MPFLTLSLGEGSPTKIDYRKKTSGALILASLLEDLENLAPKTQRLICSGPWRVFGPAWISPPPTGE